MAGGMLMQSQCDGYNGTPDKLARLETLIDILEMLIQAKNNLAEAWAWLELSGFHLVGTVPEIIRDINGLIERTKDQIREVGD